MMNLLIPLLMTMGKVAQSSPNIIMVMVDDMGYGDVSYNNGTALCPNIDEWVSSPHTILFSRGYSGSPLCSPTRASVLTGRNADRDCIYSANSMCGESSAWECSLTLPLPTETFTIAEAVKKADASYQTAFFGKWHLGDFWDKGEGHLASNPGNNGFDVWFATEGNAPTATPNCECAAFNDINGSDECVLGHFDSPQKCVTYWYANESHSHDVKNISYLVDGQYNNDALNADDSHFLITKFEEYLNDIDLDQPMLVMLWLHAPHEPIISTDLQRELCLNGTICGDSSPYFGYKNFSSLELDYYAQIADIDLQIGRIRQLLVDYNISDDTLLYFTSDNGPQYGLDWGLPGSTNGLRGEKNDMYEGGIRVPTIIEWPAIIPNDSFFSDFPIVTHDLLPTLLDILQVESDTADWELDGQSILNVLQSGGENMQRSKPIPFTYSGALGYVDNEWKYVSNSNSCQDDECEPALYNLNDDPFEENDLSQSNSAKFEEMEEAVKKWYKSVIKSQYNDSGCLYDRIRSYWEYVLIGVIAGVVFICCLCCICCLLVKYGIIAISCACFELFKCCKKEIEEEIEMNQNMSDHEKKPNDETVAV